MILYMLHILTSILLVLSLCTVFNILLLVFYLLCPKSYMLYSILYLVSTIFNIVYVHPIYICYVLDSKFYILYMLHILTSILLVPSLCTVFNILLLVFYLLCPKSYMLYSMIVSCIYYIEYCICTFYIRWFECYPQKVVFVESYPQKYLIFFCYPHKSDLLVRYPQKTVIVWVYPQMCVSLKKYPQKSWKGLGPPICEIKPLFYDCCSEADIRVRRYTNRRWIEQNTHEQVCCFVLLTRGWRRLETRPPVALGSSPELFAFYCVASSSGCCSYFMYEFLFICVCVCCFVLLNRYWGIVTVPGFLHERAKGYAPTIENRRRTTSPTCPGPHFTCIEVVWSFESRVFIENW